MEHSPVTPPAQPKRSPWRVAVLVLLPVAASLLLFGGRSHTPLQPPPILAQGMTPAPEPQFSTQPTPAGDVSLQNLHFRPLDFSGFPAFLPRLEVAYQNNAVAITDAATKRLMVIHSGEAEAANGETKVWSGPVVAASFIQDTRGGVHTLKDSTGKVLWSDAADLANPDLLFVKAQDGKARLSGAGGVTLWAGLLPPTTEGGGNSQGRGDQISIVMPGVRIDGAGGLFRVTAGKLLWAGRLRRFPLLVVRDGHSFSIYGPNGSGGGSDETRRISMEAEAGTVTVADTEGRTLGTRAVDALAIHYETEAAGARGFKWPVEHKAQEGELDAMGTLLLTYRDSTGRVLRRVTVYKDARGGSGRLG